MKQVLLFVSMLGAANSALALQAGGPSGIGKLTPSGFVADSSLCVDGYRAVVTLDRTSPSKVTLAMSADDSGAGGFFQSYVWQTAATQTQSAPGLNAATVNGPLDFKIPRSSAGKSIELGIADDARTLVDTSYFSFEGFRTSGRNVVLQILQDGKPAGECINFDRIVDGPGASGIFFFELK